MDKLRRVPAHGQGAANGIGDVVSVGIAPERMLNAMRLAHINLVARNVETLAAFYASVMKCDLFRQMKMLSGDSVSRGNVARPCSVSEPAGVYSLMDCASRPNAGFTQIKLLVWCILLLGSCSRSNLEVTPDNFIDRIIGLGERDNLFDPADVSRFLGVKFERDMTPPMDKSDTALYLSADQSLLSESKIRLTITRSLRSDAFIFFQKLPMFVCIARSFLIQRYDNSFGRGVGSSPMQLAWIVSDHKDHRTMIFLYPDEDQNGCSESLAVATLLKQ